MKYILIILSLYLIYSEKVYGNIAFVANIDGNWELFYADDEGNNPIRLTNTPYDEKTPSWSHDQKQIVYVTSDGNLNVINIASKESRQIAVNQDNAPKITPSFSPEGKNIAFAQFRPFTSDIKDDTDLMLFSLETGKTRKIIEQCAIQMWTSWSPDSKHIVYANLHCSSDCGRIIQELWIADKNSGWARQLLMTHSLCQQPDWSQDGKQIAFSSDKSGNFDIWVLSLNDLKLQQITTDENLDVSPSWSRDGSRIAFVSARTGIMEIWITDLKQNHLKKLYPFGDKIECKDAAW